MKERPITMTGPSLAQILAGTKTQTRRIVKLPADVGEVVIDPGGTDLFGPGPYVRAYRREPGNEAPMYPRIRCPYGYPGDRLWVREAWRTSLACDRKPGSVLGGHGWPIWYEADSSVVYPGARKGGPGFTTAGRFRQARFMPRWASRINLEVVSVRVERLQAITEDDARAEGVDLGSAFRKLYPSRDAAVVEERSYGIGFSQRWHEIHGRESWNANPWVWAVTFSLVAAEERAA